MAYQLKAMENPLAEQCKTSFAVHHALDEFDPGHLAFHLPVVNWQG
jgi:hypothetical protein